MRGWKLLACVQRVGKVDCGKIPPYGRLLIVVYVTATRKVWIDGDVLQPRILSLRCPHCHPRVPLRQIELLGTLPH